MVHIASASRYPMPQEFYSLVQIKLMALIDITAQVAQVAQVAQLPQLPLRARSTPRPARKQKKPNR